MLNSLSFLHRGWPIFEKGGIEKKKRDDLQRGGIRAPRKLCHIWDKGHLKHVLSVHMSVC